MIVLVSGIGALIIISIIMVTMQGICIQLKGMNNTVPIHSVSIITRQIRIQMSSQHRRHQCILITLVSPISEARRGLLCKSKIKASMYVSSHFFHYLRFDITVLYLFRIISEWKSVYLIWEWVGYKKYTKTVVILNFVTAAYLALIVNVCSARVIYTDMTTSSEFARVSLQTSENLYEGSYSVNKPGTRCVFAILPHSMQW